MAKAKVQEFKDEAGDHRIRVVAANGNITYSSSEGYKNRIDAIDSAINSAIDLLRHYESNIDRDHDQKIKMFVSKWIKKC